MSKFMQISHIPDGITIPEGASPSLASFTVSGKSYLGRIVFLKEDGSFDESGEGSKVVFLHEGPPSVPPNTKCSVHDFYKGILPGPFVETQGKVISTFVPGVGYTIHGISFEDVDVVTRGE